MKVAFEKGIYELMKENDKIIALVADSGTGMYSKIKEEMPDRYFDFGIAENSMVACAAGLASEGLIPVIYAVNNFLAYRSYEFIRNDVCIDNRNVKLVGLGAGVIQNMQGPSHHSMEDIAALRALPNMTFLSPGSPKEVRNILEAAIKYNGPVYLRLARAYETEIYEGEVPDFMIGIPNVVHRGEDVTLFATGSITGDACVAARELEKEHIGVEIVNVTSLKPIDEEVILKEAEKTGKIITLEEHNIFGGLGGIIAEILARNGKMYPFRMMGFKDTFCTEYGWHQDLKRLYGLSPESIADACREMAGVDQRMVG